MPLLLVKTDQDASLDLIITQKITKAIMEILGVTDQDVAIKYELSKERIVDLYLYDKKQYPCQKERTNDVFADLEEKIKEIIDAETGKDFTVILHLMPMERCFRGGKPRF